MQIGTANVFVKSLFFKNVNIWYNNIQKCTPVNVQSFNNTYFKEFDSSQGFILYHHLKQWPTFEL